MIYLEQLKSLLTHKWYVFLAGLRMGKIPIWRLIVHDWSKLTPVELINYSRFKHGVKSVPGWSRAWLHHMHHSPHHPEHWVLSWRGDPDFYRNHSKHVAEFVTILPMPETYVRELVVDIMATGKEITGSWDIASWLNENGPRMLLHDDTITRLDAVMRDAGYTLTDNCDWSWIKSVV